MHNYTIHGDPFIKKYIKSMLQEVSNEGVQVKRKTGYTNQWRWKGFKAVL